MCAGRGLIDYSYTHEREDLMSSNPKPGEMLLTLGGWRRHWTGTGMGRNGTSVRDESCTRTRRKWIVAHMDSKKQIEVRDGDGEGRWHCLWWSTTSGTSAFPVSPSSSEVTLAIISLKHCVCDMVVSAHIIPVPLNTNLHTISQRRWRLWLLLLLWRRRRRDLVTSTRYTQEQRPSRHQRSIGRFQTLLERFRR